MNLQHFTFLQIWEILRFNFGVALDNGFNKCQKDWREPGQKNINENTPFF